MNKLDKLDILLCDRWNKNKNINPTTRRSITRNGSTYNRIKKACDKIYLNTDTDKDSNKDAKKKGKGINKDKDIHEKIDNKIICEKWNKKKDINPLTGKKIKINGPKYNYLKTLCSDIKLSSSLKDNLSSNQYSDETSSSNSSYFKLLNINKKELEKILKNNIELRNKILKLITKLNEIQKSKSASYKSAIESAPKLAHKSASLKTASETASILTPKSASFITASETASISAPIPAPKSASFRSLNSDISQEEISILNEIHDEIIKAISKSKSSSKSSTKSRSENKYNWKYLDIFKNIRFPKIF